ncbi:tenascin-N-like [Manacus vitellinus]|uniref:tenascin-N-like n=1 Tax=Manacus vitellinus TaxID=328815 RepID=UPI00115DFBA2|nr:tenascin-N-like [Manacus vitellinus]
MEKLEKEVAELREVCSPQKCCGGSQGVPPCSGRGTVLDRPATNCSGHRTCDTATGVCQHHEEFTSEDCADKRCPGDCSGNGFCDTGECYCHNGLFGLDCSQGVDSPTNVTTNQVTEHTATVSWNKVETPIDRYMVRYTSVDGDTKDIEVRSDNNMITLLDLKPGMEYVIHIWAEKGPQRSKKASTRTVTEINNPTELLSDQVTEDTITVSWNKVQASIDRYRLSYTLANGDTEETEVEKDKNVTPLAGLEPGTEYIIYIWAEKGEQQSKRVSTEAVTGKWTVGFVECKLRDQRSGTVRLSPSWTV